MAKQRRRSQTHSATGSGRPAAFARADQNAAPPLGEIAVSYTNTWDNLTPAAEYNAALSGNRAILTYDKMRRSDAQVAALEAIISLPVRAVNWWMDAGGTGAADAEAAALIQANLFEGMTITWDDFLRQMLLSVLVGFAAHEKVFQETDGYIRWRKFGDLPQTSILQFTASDESDRPGVKQGGLASAGLWDEIAIPPEKLLITTYRLEGRNFGGFPVLRQAYKHWFIKDSVYRIMNLGIENNLIGTIVGTAPLGINETQRQKFLKLIEDIRARNITGLIKDADMLLEILEAKRNPIDVLPYIEHHDVQIARTALAQFINLGQTTTGARSLSEDHSKIFMVAEQTLARAIADNLNRYAIPQLCLYNWPGMKVFPKLLHEHPRTVLDLDNIGFTLAELVSGQLLTPDAEVEDRVRELYGLPPLPEPAARDQSAEKKPPPAASAAADEDAAQKAVAARPLPDHAAPGGPAAFAAPDVSAIGTLFDQIDDDFQQAAGKLLDEYIALMEKAVRPRLAKLDPGAPLSRARVYPLLAKLELPNPDRYAKCVRDYLTTLAQAGADAAAEVTGEAAPAMSRDLRAFIGAQADLLANRHLTEIRVLFCQQVFDGAIGEVAVGQAVADAAQAARDRANGDFRDYFRQAFLALADHLTEGVT
jgi:hypothetical protein